MFSNITCILLIYLIKNIQCLEKELTVNVDPFREDCFYQSVKRGNSIEIEYQVIGGGHGDLDITFNLIDPTGRILVADYKKSENSHSVDVQMDGDFKFCFDNTFSSLNSKTVFFELVVDGDAENEWSSETYDFQVKALEDINVNIKDVLDAVNSVRNQLNKAKHLQDLLKSSEARDRNVAEETYFKVNAYSIFTLVLITVLSFIQLVMVKSLFDDKSKVHIVWQYLDKHKRIF